MVVNNISKGKTAAEKVLEENYLTEPPIPVDELARSVYGLTVYETDFAGLTTNNIAGFIDLSSNEIAVNASDAPSRKIFTIAHELAHYIMHRRDLKVKPEIGMYYRRPLGEPDPDPLEQQANAFAANLLVPERLLRKYSHLSDSTLAKLFAVSTDVIGYRRKNLNLR